jgi:hypothetical protein
MVETQQLLWNPTLKIWQQQTISTLTSQAIPDAPLSEVIYREGDPSNFVYGHFADAVNAINKSGMPATIYVDNSLEQPTVPSGTYDLSLISLYAFPGQINTSLNIQDGAKLSSAPSVIDGGLGLYSYSNSPVIDQPNLSLALRNGSWLQADGYAPFIHVGHGATAQLFLSDASYLAGSASGSTSPIISSDGYSVLTGINVGNWCDIGQGALDGYGAAEVNLISPSATIEAQPTAYGLTINNANVAPPSASSSYAQFFALMPGDNSATVAVGAAVAFPQDGPTSGSIVRTGPNTFNLPIVGTYEVSWQVSISEPGQLQLAIGGVGLPNTVVGRATGTSQLFGMCLITTSVTDSILSVMNPSGNSTALTITPIAGGTSPVSATLLIKML